MIHPGNFPYQNIRTFEVIPGNNVNRDAVMPDIIDLRNKKLIRFDMHNVYQVSEAPSGRTALAIDECYISFLDENGKTIYDMVSNKVFYPLDNDYFRKIISKIVSFPKSFITTGIPGLVFDVTKSFVVTAFYNDKPLQSLQNKKPIHSRTLEVLITDQEKKKYVFNSNDTKIFKGKKIRYITWYKPQVTMQFPPEIPTSPKNNAIATLVPGAYLNMVDESGKTAIDHYPVSSLQAFYQKMTDRITLDDLQFDWEKSNIEFSPLSTLPVNQAILLEIYYTD